MRDYDRLMIEIQVAITWSIRNPGSGFISFIALLYSCEEEAGQFTQCFGFFRSFVFRPFLLIDIAVQICHKKYAKNILMKIKLRLHLNWFAAPLNLSLAAISTAHS